MTTKNNWFITNLKERTKYNLCDFELKINPYHFEPKKFKEESKRVANEIQETFQNLYLAYSGGSDSEFVLKTFKEEKIKIIPIIIRTPFNEDEFNLAIDFCIKNDIKKEILNYSKNEIIDKLKEKTIDKGLFSLLGGLPLIMCDEINKVSGSLLTGYGDPFSIIPGKNKDVVLEKKLEFSEWDYYLDSYDNRHPSGFFTYDLGLFYSLINEIHYSFPLQFAKSFLYQLPERKKIFWKKEFYDIFREIKIQVNHNFFIEQKKLIENLYES